MLINLFTILKTVMLFRTSYSNNVFKEPLPKEEEEKYFMKMCEINNAPNYEKQKQNYDF